MFTIYHNPKCAKSRAGLEFLKLKGVEYKVVEYLKEPLTRDHFKELLMKLGKSAKDIIRTQEDIFKENFRGKNFTEEEWITILLENPKLIQRPIVVSGYKAVLAQPAEEIDKLIVK
jgi:arsenate reductase (glutaredoxin)